jgi:ribonuclease P/MRP protein subunit RPP1
MKRLFADLHLRLTPRDLESSARVVSKAASLGYDLVAVPISQEDAPDERKELANICKNAGIDFASRVDLNVKTRDQLTNRLRKLRRRYELICVSCESKEIARQAAKDRRVDLINFTSLDYNRRFLDRSEAELISSSLAAWEIDAKPLYVLEGPTRTRFISTLKREISIAKEFKIPIVLSSGASNEWLLRKPRELASLAGLFNLDEGSALNAVSATPVSILKRNREKLGSGYIAPGISVLKEGSDC